MPPRSAFASKRPSGEPPKSCSGAQRGPGSGAGPSTQHRSPGKTASGPQQQAVKQPSRSSTVQNNRNASVKNSAPAKKRKESSQTTAAAADTRAAKRARIRDDRNIATQVSDSAVKDGELDVQAFLGARRFEINALDESMRRSRANRSRRAFQQLPFKLRRRAGAHNHKRVPRRLQRKARKEMIEDNTPTVNSRTRKPKTTRARLRAETAKRLAVLARRKKLLKLAKSGADEATIQVRMARPKIKRNVLNSPAVIAVKFRRRQQNKTWLPTHLWHAKRARMTSPNSPLWRFAIPLTPTDKVFRPTHRAHWEKGAVAWDMSYVNTIGLCGHPKSVEGVLRAVGLVHDKFWNEKGQRWRSGGIHWAGTLTRQNGASTRMMGPATIIWNPELDAAAGETGEAPKESRRRLFIRVHPSIFLETFDELLRLAKMQTPRPYLEDLRFEIGSIDVTGPDATEALLGVLTPYFKGCSKEAHAARFESLAGLRDIASLPSGSILAFSVMDPRLRFPPRRAEKAGLVSADPPSMLPEAITSQPRDEKPMPFGLFNRDARFKASRLPSQRSLNCRRGNGRPGAYLEPTMVDPPIPIILAATRHESGSRTSGTWTLMLPWRCVLPVWYGLMHYPLTTGDNPGFGGLNEARQITSERGTAWFPGDAPGTDAGAAWELEQRQLRKAAWERMPKGKRVNYETLDLGAGRKGEVGSGWSCDFETLFGLPTVEEAARDDGSSRAAPDGEAGPRTADDSKPTRLRGSPLGRLIHLSKPEFDGGIASHSSRLPPLAVVNVRITILSRGVPDSCARIYRLPDAQPAAQPAAPASSVEVPATVPPRPGGVDAGRLPPDLREQWLARIPHKPPPRSKRRAAPALTPEARQRLIARELLLGGQGPDSLAAAESRPGTQDNILGHPVCPDAEDLMGFVTTGGFNLRAGRGEAVASVSAEKAREELRRYGNGDDPAARICVVRNAGQSIGWVARWALL